MAVQTLLQKEEALKGAQGLGYSSIDAVRKAILPASTNTFKLNIGDTIDSRLLSGNTTTLDAENVRRAKEQQQITQNESRLAFEQGLAGIRSKPESTDFISSLMFPQVTATTQARDELATQQRGLLQQAREFITGRTTDSAGRLAQLQEEGGVPALQERIAASNERVAQLQGELMKARPQIETEAGQTRIGAEARLAPVERNLRAEIASEALVQSALVGNLEAVQGNIDKILELEFQDEQAQLNDMMLSIQLVGEEINTLEPKLQEEANQRLAQFQFALQERASALQEAQTNKAGVLQILSQAAQNGAPESVLNAIKSAQTPEQALALTGGYMSDPLDRQYKSLQIQKMRSELSGTTGGAIDWGDRAAILKLAEAGDPLAVAALGYNPQDTPEKRQAKITAQENAIKELEKINALVGNRFGIKSSAGAVQSPLLTSMFGGLTGGAVAGATAGTVAFPALGTIAGGAGGGLLGLGAGTVSGLYSRSAKQDFLGEIQYLLSGDSFEKFRELKASGVTFGPTSNAEWQKVDSAANQLSAIAIKDKDGNITGFRGSEDKLQELLTEYQQKAQKFVDSLNAQQFSQDDSALIDGLPKYQIPTLVESLAASYRR